MASHQLIDGYLARLSTLLPADIVDELDDGLHEAWQHHLATGLEPDEAARAVVAEFGSADRVADEFVAQAPGRRTARVLLLTGPVMALCWGTSLIAAKVWTWRVPLPAGALYLLGLLGVVAALVAAASSRHSYRRTRLGVVAALGLVVLDATMIGAVAALAPVLIWPMAIAAAASLVRIGYSITSLPHG